MTGQDDKAVFSIPKDTNTAESYDWMLYNTANSSI
jgi:hypothetical protein